MTNSSAIAQPSLLRTLLMVPNRVRYIAVLYRIRTTKQITTGRNWKTSFLLKTLLFSGLSGAGDGTRTRNLLITNQLLYQLSYAGRYLSKRQTL